MDGVDQLYRGTEHLWAQERYVYLLELRAALIQASIDLDELPDPEPEPVPHPRLSDRNEQILDALQCDRTLADIAGEFGMTRQAISLIAISNGLRRRDRK